jgi:hypothetical protein
MDAFDATQKDLVVVKDKELRMELIKLVIDLHKDKGAETKRITADLEALYAFLTK